MKKVLLMLIALFSFNVFFVSGMVMEKKNVSLEKMEFVNGYVGNTDMALNMMNADVEIQDGSIMTLAEWINDNAYSNFEVSDFWNYMSVWKSICYGYQNYIMAPRLQPKLIYSIINEINNN